MAWQVLLGDRRVDGTSLVAVHVEVRRDGHIRAEREVTLDVAPTGHDVEQLRWYFEDFVAEPYDPAPRLADEARRRLRTLGTVLHEALVAAVVSSDLDLALGTE